MSNRIFFGGGCCLHPLLGRILRVLWHVKSSPRGYQAITIKWSRFGHAEIYALVRQWTTRLIPRSKTVSSHQISILPRNQGLFISVARKLVNFEGNRVFFDCSYGSRQQVLVPFTQLLSHGRFKIMAPPFQNGISTVFPGKSALGTLQMPIRFLFSVFFFS